MPKSVTFAPDAHPSARSQDITYAERISRNRSLHFLLQDHASNPVPSRQQFLKVVCRELISRYVSIGRIEHPLAMARGFIHFLEGLSRHVSTRVDDPVGLGIYILLQDGNTFHLLTTREGAARLRRNGEAWSAVDSRHPQVREVPVKSPEQQQELFERTMRGSLVFYRVEPGPGGSETEFLLGGSGDESSAVMDAIDDPGYIERTSDGSVVGMGLLSRTVSWCRFQPVAAERVALDPVPKHRWRMPGRRDARLVGAAAFAIVVSAGAVLLAQMIGLGNPAPADVARRDTPQAEEPAVTAQESPARLRERSTAPPVASDTRDLVTDAPAAEPPRVEMEVAWSRELSEPVTTTPVIDGDVVVFGARDGRVYAHDRESGEERWAYKAVDGVGSSPVLAGTVVIAADYAGNVFSLDRKNGEAIWTRRLPAKVVSTACAAGGELLVGCLDGSAYGLSLETGRILWQVETGARVRASAARTDGQFFVPSYDGNLYAIAQGSGKVVWKHKVGGQVASSPAAANGIVVVGSERGGVRAVDAHSGKVRWTFDTGGPVKSFVAIEGQRVFVGANDGGVYCLDLRNGAEVWRYMTGGPVLSRPWVTDRYVFVTSYDRHLHCLDVKTGYRVARLATGGSIYSSPVFDGEHVFFGNNAGRFYCVRIAGGTSL